MDANINSITMSYELQGNPSNPPIVFIHGFPFNQTMWQPQVEALKNTHYVITYNVRGHGQTETGDGQYTIELFVDDLVALLDHLKLQSVILAGLSMGGYIALRAMERHPEKFKALILCDTKSEPDSNENKINRARQIRAINERGLAIFAEGFLKAVFHERSFSTNQQAISIVRDAINGNKPAGVTGTLLALAARTDTTPSLHSIHVPTLILVGEYDAITPPHASRTMRENIPNAEWHIIPDAAHMSNLENTKVFNYHLLSFLSRLS